MWYHGFPMIKSNFDLKQFNELLIRAVHEAGLLENALEQETAALSERQVDALNEAVANKLQIAQSLEQLTREQNQLLSDAGFDLNAEGLQAYLHVWDPQGLVRPQWQQLQVIMERCRQLNQVNGGAVALQQRQVQQAIHALRGADNSTELYDPCGRAVASSASGHISSKA